jgi:hypothetical protein
MRTTRVNQPGPSLLYRRCLEAPLPEAWLERAAFFVSNRWMALPDLALDDGLDTLIDDAALYRDLRLPDGRTLSDCLASMTKSNRGELAFMVASLGVSKAVLMRDFPDADAVTLDAVTAIYSARYRGRPPTSRQMFRQTAKAVQANVFIDCFVRRRAYGDFDEALYWDCFRHAYAAYRYLTEGFAETLCPSQAWVVMESVLSGALEFSICAQSRQPFFHHASLGGRGRSPFLRFNEQQPSAADRSLMRLLDRGGHVVSHPGEC